MYKGMAIIAVRETDQQVKLIMLESSKSSNQEEDLMQKEWALERGIVKLLDIDEEDVLWARMITKPFLLRRNLRLTSVEEERSGQVLITLSEGPTRKREQQLWSIMSKEQKIAWTEETYMTVGKVLDVIESEDLLRILESVERRGIIVIRTRATSGTFDKLEW